MNVRKYVNIHSINTVLTVLTDTTLSVGARVFTIDYNYTDTVLCTQDQVPQHDRQLVHVYSL